MRLNVHVVRVGQRKELLVDAADAHAVGREGELRRPRAMALHVARHKLAKMLDHVLVDRVEDGPPSDNAADWHTSAGARIDAEEIVLVCVWVQATRERCEAASAARRTAGHWRGLRGESK